MDEQITTTATDAAPYPQPTSNPPGGGRWAWDSQNGAWIEVVPAADPATEPQE